MIGTLYKVIIFFRIFGFVFSNENPAFVDDLIENIVKSKRLRENGYTEFTVSMFREINPKNGTVNSVTPEYIRRRRSAPEEDGSPLEFTFGAFNENFNLTLKHSDKLLLPYVPVFTRTVDSVTVWGGKNPDCFMNGVTSRRGVAALSYCNGITGSITEGGFQYRIDPLGEMHEDYQESVLISKSIITEEVLNDERDAEQLLNNTKEQDETNKEPKRRKRAVPSSITIELGIFLDEEFVQLLENDKKALTVNEKIFWVVTKWNGVQSRFAVPGDLDIDVIIEIKFIEFWRTNPTWFDLNKDDMVTTHKSFCRGLANIANLLNVDHHHLHTRVTNDPTASGYSYIPATCTPLENRCSVTSVTNFFASYTAAHEIGHSLKMVHDHERSCVPPNTGFMDSQGNFEYRWSTCSKNSLHDYLGNANETTFCLFHDNVADADVVANIANITLTPEWPGMVYNKDEQCVIKHGAGWRYRDFYLPTDCSWHCCINMNEGPFFGTMITDSSRMSGTYCGDGYLCSGYSCVPWQDTRVPDAYYTVIEGSWSEWGAFTSCSRTCGTGIALRERSCDNPKPKNAASCSGSAYDAAVCSTTPCDDEVSLNLGDLRKRRAGETCSRFVADGVLDSADYDGSGERVYWKGVGQCEVKCKVASGSTVSISYGTKYGLIPDGTPCDIDIERTYSEIKGYPRGRGHYGLCVQGYCEVFGCDGTNSGVTRDFCGVCNGDNSTCDMYDGVYTNNVPAKTRVDFRKIPAGTVLIQFYFDYSKMDLFYVELWDTNGNALLASRKNYVYWDTSANPAIIAGTGWYYRHWIQYLYADGPTTEDLWIKIFNYGNSTNKGITFGFSILKDTSQLTTNTPSTNNPASTVTPGKCSVGMIECFNGNCVLYDVICNGVDDCGDGTDESYFSCYISSGPTVKISCVLAMMWSVVMTLLS